MLPHCRPVCGDEPSCRLERPPLSYLPARATFHTPTCLGAMYGAKVLYGDSAALEAPMRIGGCSGSYGRPTAASPCGFTHFIGQRPRAVQAAIAKRGSICPDGNNGKTTDGNWESTEGQVGLESMWDDMDLRASGFLGARGYQRAGFRKTQGHTGRHPHPADLPPCADILGPRRTPVYARTLIWPEPPKAKRVQDSSSLRMSCIPAASEAALGAARYVLAANTGRQPETGTEEKEINARCF